MSQAAVSNTGVVFDVSRGCVDDGPGLRTVVFLKGCQLGCPWCQNPEGLSAKPEIGFDIDRCLGCNRCAEACGPGGALQRLGDRWREACKACGRCAEACPSGARRLFGRRLSPEELCAELLEDRDFFQGTGGGVTFSGGEPLLQADWLFACAQLLRTEGVHVAVETAGMWPMRLAPRLTSNVDLVLFDLKHVDLAKLRTTMGRDCSKLLDNLTALLRSDVAMQLRLTLVPGFNACREDLSAIADWLEQQPRLPQIHKLHHHRLADAKRSRLGSGLTQM